GHAAGGWRRGGGEGGGGNHGSWGTRRGGNSANATAFAGGRVARGIHADPAFVNGLAGALIAGVTRDAQAVFRAIVEGGVHQEHAEREEITGAILRRQPAAAELVAKDGRIVRERAREGPLAGLRVF